MSVYARYLDYPVGAKEDCTPAGSGRQAFSTDAAVLEGAADAPWATLEQDVWTLDGTRQLLEDAPQDIGWWSRQLAGDDGTFVTPPTMTLHFGALYTATGLSFHFGEDGLCTDMHIAWYAGAQLCSEVTVHPDVAQYTLQHLAESFDTVVIRFLRVAAPKRFLRLLRLQVGQIVDLTQSELCRVRLLNEVDPSGCELSQDTLTLEFEDRAGRRWAPQENQTIELYRDGRLLAVQYLERSTRQADHHYTFQCHSLIGQLEDTFLGGIYSGVPVQTLLSDILQQYPFVLDPAFADQTLSGWLPVGTRREALQQVCLAMGALCSTQGGAALRLYPAPESAVFAIPNSRIFTGAQLETQARIAVIQLHVHSYLPADAAACTQLLQEEIHGENVLYTFAQPYAAYQIDGGVLEGSGSNWARITADGAVTLRARPYAHTVRTLTRRDPAATAADIGNLVAVENATLVTEENAQAVLERLYGYYQLRQVLTQDIAVTNETAGQRVVSAGPWDGQISGYITRMDSELTRGGWTTQLTVIGQTVPKQPVWEYAGQTFAGVRGLP